MPHRNIPHFAPANRYTWILQLPRRCNGNVPPCVPQRDGNLPCCPSGGALGVGNPIAATGLMKVIELYLQLSGQAGKRQVPGQPKTGVVQAWGDLMQVGTVVVMRN